MPSIMFRRAALVGALVLLFSSSAGAADGDSPAMDDMSAAAAPMSAMSVPMMMSGTLGSYPFTRDASGTSWQPDTSVHEGLHIMSGDWMYMAHARIDAGYDWQQGPRGDTGEMLTGMIMGSAHRSFDDGDGLTFRIMLSPDPVMGPRGYPLLLASGETANGITPLVDRQHPHDLFMELSGSYSHEIADTQSVFVYAGWPGEPAFGPPAFMHRMSIMDSPEAPISHHWLDSTHITFGVLTGGYVDDDWKLEASGFKGREPNQNRTDIEAAKLDSESVRASWNPTARLALQVSWAHLTSPEQLQPLSNQNRVSASAIYTVPLADGWWSTTAAWGRRQETNSAGMDGPGLNAWVLESAFKPSEPWTVFARAEATETDELGTPPGVVATVGKTSIGVIHDWQVGPHAAVGLGGLYAWNWVPGVLRLSYGSSDPQGAIVFVRLLLK